MRVSQRTGSGKRKQETIKDNKVNSEKRFFMKTGKIVAFYKQNVWKILCPLLCLIFPCRKEIFCQIRNLNCNYTGLYLIEYQLK